MHYRINHIPPRSENYQRFCKPIINKAKKYIPRGVRKSYIPCWTNESEALFKKYKESGDPDTGKKLMTSLKEGRCKRWSEEIAAVDFTHSSRRAWSLLRKLGWATQQTPTAKGNSKWNRTSASSKWLRQERSQAGKTHTETTARSTGWLPRNIKFVTSIHQRWSHQCPQGNKGREGCWTRRDLPRHVEEHRASCGPMAAGFLRWCDENSKYSKKYGDQQMW